LAPGETNVQQIQTHKSKLNKNKAGGVAQVVENLPSKLKALSLKPSTAKTQKQKSTKKLLKQTECLSWRNLNKLQYIHSKGIL
jgi:hypothetical protein